GELVELLELASPDVEVDERETLLAVQRVERLTERRRDAADVPEARGVEAAAVTEDLPDRLVLPGRHVLEHVEQLRGDLEAVARAAKQSQRRGDLVREQMPGRRLDLEAR